MFDDETEQLCEEVGVDIALPPYALRTRLDSKIETTRLGNEAGVASAPNTMGRATSYAELIGARRGRRARVGPGGADALRRFGAHHVLHQVRGGLGPLRAEDEERSR